MSSFPPTFAEGVINQPAKAQFEAFLDEHRRVLNDCLDGLTEEQVRRSLVQSRTTLLGLVKHATFVEKVWFDEAVTCRSRAEIGIPATPDESFIGVAAWIPLPSGGGGNAAPSLQAQAHIGKC
ncbi:DinB family protein [Micromonospora sp. NBC_00389]|uniref:mycothiol transferase n=1 Tax=Micromonospora sp. NBC_00389 TaxID=2903586 RepID=UPI002E20A0FC